VERACVLADTPYSFKTRFENEKGTNPEELIAAAHVAGVSHSGRDAP
jgi:organic hydroperoxide reductase OsmC/OhrA